MVCTSSFHWIIFTILLIRYPTAISVTSFSYESSSSTVPGLQVASTGETFLTEDNTLYRLSPQLVQEERYELATNVIDRGLTLSANGSVLVVCFVNLSCSVFNAYNLSVGPLKTVSNAFASNELGVALFTAEDTFYTGSVTGTSGDDRMVLQQHGEGFVRSSDNNDIVHGGGYDFTRSFTRHFYDGFEKDDFAYYFVFDSNPVVDRGFRILRVCHRPNCGGTSSCGVNAMYEGTFICGANALSSNRARICGLSLIEDFGGLTGPVAVVSRCEISTTRNAVCLVSLTAANEAMDRKSSSCSTASLVEEIDIAWGTQLQCLVAYQAFSEPEVCNTPSPLGVTIPSVFRVATGLNLISASVAVKVEELSYVFVGTSDLEGIDSILGYDVTGSSISFAPFYTQPVSSIVHQLVWKEGQNYITAATSEQVFQFALECSYYTDCASCIADVNLQCGWCVVENKCSIQSQCQNSTLTTSMRWSSSQCINAVINPKQCVLDSSNTALLTVTFNSSSPLTPLPGETFFCHLVDAAGELPPVVVLAVEEVLGTVFSCSLQGRLPNYQGFSTEITVSFVSSLLNSTFDITGEAITVYRCSESSSCSECLQAGSPCGWCHLDKICREKSLCNDVSDCNSTVVVNCTLPVDLGGCNGSAPRYYFNSVSGVCELFSYSGCGGNTNNFESLKDCNQYCNPNECPPYCSVEYCSNKNTRRALCTLQNPEEDECRVKCRVTYCRICYYDDETHSLPGGCRTCSSFTEIEQQSRCFRQWTTCTRRADGALYPKLKRRERTEDRFKCYEHPCLST